MGKIYEKKPITDLERMAVEARNQGMTYGQYMAKKQKESVCTWHRDSFGNIVDMYGQILCPAKKE